MGDFKPLIFISLILFNQRISSQNPSNEFFKLEVLCYKEKIKQNEGAIFIIKLINNSDSSYTIKRTLIVENEEYGGDIGYQVYYCAVGDTAVMRSNAYGQPWLFDVLEIFSPVQPLIKEVKLDETIFKRKGIYKVRFSFHLERIIKSTLPIVKSDWIFFEAL